MPHNTGETPPTPAPPLTPVPAPSPADVKRYHRAKRNLHIVNLALTLAYWLAWCWLINPLMGAVEPAVHVRWLGLTVAAVVSFGLFILVMLPLEYYGDFILEHRYHLSNQTPRAWLIFQLKAWLVGAVIGAIVLGGLYALLWHSGRLWGVWVWLGMMLLSVVLAKVFPLIILPLFYPARPLDRPALIDRLRGLAAGTGMKLTGVFDLELSKDTKKANAMLTGLGSSRRVYLSDTLLDAFDDAQIGVVFAHELGHHIRKHIWKGIGLTAVLTSLLVALIYWRLNPFAGPDASLWTAAVRRLPQVILVAVAFPLLLSPLTNAISRHFERQCDSDALRLTSDPVAYRGAFEQLGRMNLADPTPPRWEEILFDDHPALAKRIAMADAYERRC